jgi:hypothetical protein
MTTTTTKTTFRKGRVLIHTGAGKIKKSKIPARSEEVDGMLLSGWAVHRAHVSVESGLVATKEWAITHAATGLAVATNIPSEAKARAALRELLAAPCAAGWDWTSADVVNQPDWRAFGYYALAVVRRYR